MVRRVRYADYEHSTYFSTYYPNNGGKTARVTYSGQYNNYWGRGLSMTRNETAGTIVYTYVLNPGATVPVGSNSLVGSQFGGNGTRHDTSGDTDKQRTHGFSATAATFGTVVATGGLISEIALDESRGRLYMANVGGH